MLSILFLLLAIQDGDVPVEVIVEKLPDGSSLEYEALPGADGERLRHGEFAMLDSEGKKRVIGEYDQGKKSGRWNYRYQDGKPWVTGGYSEGERHGKWTFRHSNREYRAKGSYQNGQAKGAWEFFDEAGSRIESQSGVYQPIISHHLDQTVEFRGQLLDGQLHGRWTSFWGNGARQLEVEFARGRRVGSWRFWHSDGTYDPELLSANHEGGSQFLELYEEPIAIANGGGPVLIQAAAARTPRPEPTPSRLMSVDSSLLDAEVSRAVAKYKGGVDALQAESRELVVSRGTGALGSILEYLRTLDYAKDSDLALARVVVTDLLTPIFQGHALLTAEQIQSPKELKLAVLRAHSLFALARRSQVWWSFDMQIKEHPPGSGVCSLLLQPPIPVEALYGSGSGSGAGVYAARRKPNRDLRSVGGSGTSESLSAALKWLVANQKASGSWEAKNAYHEIGVTALALLALLGDGNTMDHGVHQESVRRAARWIVDNQDQENGLIQRYVETVNLQTKRRIRMYSPQYLYDHAVATLALCELAGLSRSPGIRSAAQKGINFAAQCRNRYGVWRYDVPATGDNDSSMTGWMMHAYFAAKSAGLDVDEDVLNYATTWFDEVTDRQSGRIGYSSIGEPSCRYSGLNDHYPQEHSESNTAVGLWYRQQVGQDPEQYPIVSKHADLMLRTLPEWDEDEGYTIDFSYWYFGSYGMRALGGKHWKAWNKALKEALVDSQINEGQLAGSWEPKGTWGMFGGRAYSTAMAALCLEVYFRYEP